MIKYCLLVLCLWSGSLLARPDTAVFRHVADAVFAANPAAVGMVVHVEAPDLGISWSYAAGLANRNTGQLLSPEMTLLVASNTKPYVAAAVLRLVEKNKLKMDQPVGNLLSDTTKKLLQQAGYRPDSITIRQLLSHTSGIRDYVDEGYFSFISIHPKYEWSRDEQIARAAGLGAPLGSPGSTFKYADINYILLTEIMDCITGRPFYETMPDLLSYRRLQLRHTRFTKLQPTPQDAMQQAHQYWDHFGWDTYELDPSWDLFGGGGMTANVKELALFFQYLFNGKVIKSKKVLALMYEDVPPNLEVNYCLGIRKIQYTELPCYNHGGGLGTDVVYVPELNASIAVAALEASHRTAAMEITKEIIQKMKEDRLLSVPQQ